MSVFISKHCIWLLYVSQACQCQFKALINRRPPSAPLSMWCVLGNSIDDLMPRNMLYITAVFSVLYPLEQVTEYGVSTCSGWTVSNIQRQERDRAGGEAATTGCSGTNQSSENVMKGKNHA